MVTNRLVWNVALLSMCCGSAAPAADQSGFDVCDVSFLIPPSARSVHLAGGDNQRPLLSRAIFAQFEDFVKRGHPQLSADEAYESLVVTGIRFDPCGPMYPKDYILEKCVLPNLRVIAQVYRDGHPTNAALHMVFLLRSPSELKIVNGELRPTAPLDITMRDDLISRLASMKSRNSAAGISTAGVTAGVHPVFNREFRGSPRLAEFESELKSLLETYCVESRYFLTAVMFADKEYGTAHPDRERWVWQKGNVDRTSGNIVLKFGGIPGFPVTLKEQTFSADSGERTGGVVSPPSTLVKNGVRNAAIESILKGLEKLDRGSLQEAIDATDRLENPERVAVNDDDCASCHVSTTAREFVTQARDGGDNKRALKYAFAVNPQLTQELDNPQLLLQRSNGYRIMSFAFLDGTPSVSQRTINESTQAAHVVNLILAQRR